MSETKVGVFLSDCGKQLSEILDFKALTNYVKKVSGVTLIGRGSEFWRGKVANARDQPLDPDHLAANFNMANILEEEGSLLPAISFYEKTLSLDPFFADAHFNLALVYEKLQLKKRARPHWKKFIELKPNSEEVSVARRFLEE